MEWAGSRKTWVRLDHDRICQVLLGFLRGVGEKGAWPALKDKPHVRFGVEAGCTRECRGEGTNKTKTTLGDKRPIATLEPSRVGGIRVLYGTRSITPVTGAASNTKQTHPGRTHTEDEFSSPSASNENTAEALFQGKKKSARQYLHKVLGKDQFKNGEVKW